MTDLDQDPLEVIETGDWVRVDGDNGIVEVVEAGRRVSGGDDERWYEIEKTRGDWFTDGDAADERPERTAPDTTVREEARDVPVHAEADVLVVGGGPAGCARRPRPRAWARTCSSSSGTATSAGLPRAGSSSGSTG